MFVFALIWLAGAATGLKSEAEALMRLKPADERAGQLLEQAVAADPNDAEAFYLLGRWALVKGRYEQAIHAETRAAQLSPSNPVAQMQAWTIVGVANDHMNKPAEAETALKKALTINRTLAQFDPNSAHEYVKLLEAQHRFEEVESLLAEILRRAPKHPASRLSRAKRLLAKKNFALAAEEAEFALKSSGQNRALERDSRFVLARVYLALGDRARADLHKRWLSENP